MDVENLVHTKSDWRFFPVTEWKQVKLSRDSMVAQEELFKIYWPPLLGFALAKGYNEADSKDLVQGFFHKIISNEGLKTVDNKRGKFRTFLLTGFVNFMRSEWHKQTAEKRGGKDAQFISLNADEAESFIAEAKSYELNPEEAYERIWVRTLLRNSVGRLRQHYIDSGKQERFEVLAPYLMPGNKDYAGPAKTLNCKEDSIKRSVKRLRKKYRACIKEEIALTLGPGEDVEDEFASLLMAFTR